MSDQEYLPKGKGKQVTQTKTTNIQPKKTGLLSSVFGGSVWATKNDTKRLEAKTDHVQQHTKLGEAMFGLEMMKDKFAHLEDYKDMAELERTKEHNETLAESLEAENRIAEAKREADLRSLDDEIQATKKSVELQKAKEELERLVNPKPGMPEPEPEPDDPVSRMKKELDKEEEILVFQKDMLAKADQMRADGVPEAEVKDFIESLEAAIARERRQRD